MLEIVEAYRDFKPPPGITGMVGEMLRSVPEQYLVGLKSIILANRATLSRDQRRQKIWSRNRKVKLAESRGAYYRSTPSSAAVVWLYIDNILRSEPPWILRVPLLRYQALGNVLFHEIGHHIHATHTPVHEEKENVAETWSRKLSIRFYRTHYWYLAPLISLPSLLSKIGKRLRKTARHQEDNITTSA